MLSAGALPGEKLNAAVVEACGGKREKAANGDGANATNDGADAEKEEEKAAEEVVAGAKKEKATLGAGWAVASALDAFPVEVRDVENAAEVALSRLRAGGAFPLLAVLLDLPACSDCRRRRCI